LLFAAFSSFFFSSFSLFWPFPLTHLMRVLVEMFIVYGPMGVRRVERLVERSWMFFLFFFFFFFLFSLLALCWSRSRASASMASWV
jgi:hypothetical protein